MPTRSMYDEPVIDQEGDALEGIEITVYDAGTTNESTIYSGRTGGGTIANPITTDATGNVQFWAEPASYDIAFHDPELPARIADREITWEAVSGANEGIAQEQVEGLADLIGSVAPSGAIHMWPTNSAPTGFLLCDGTAVSRATYADLFAVIGETYGAGNGSTTFNLPNFKGKVPVGRDSGQTEFDVLAETGGAKTHTLITEELPSHRVDWIVEGSGMPAGIGFAASQQTIGGDDPHNNLQPYLIVNFIIKT